MADIAPADHDEQTAASSPRPASIWTEDIGWPFRTPPPTRDFLLGEGRDPEALRLLALNEAPLAPPQSVADHLARAVHYLNRYPDNIHYLLSAAVAKAHEVDNARQVWGSGAGELIGRAVAIATQAGLNVVSPSPTFWGYERVYALQRADVRRTPLRPDGAIDVDALLAAIDHRTGLVTFATPGNPSGLSLSGEEIAAIARRTPDDALLMVDEVYHEFCAHEGGPDALSILRKERTAPWLVLRSFSKAYRLAGARVGYGFASDPATAQRIRDFALNFTISSLGFAAALAAFEDRSALRDYLDQNAQVKRRLRAGLAEAGATPLESAANFVAAALPEPATGALAHLRGQGVLCAGWNHPDFPNHIRIGIGAPEDAEAVCAALGRFLHEGRTGPAA